MKTLLLLFTFTLTAAASTPVYDCMNITGGTDTYILQNDLPASGTVSTCLEVTTQYTGYVNLDCDGHSITATYYPLHIYGSAAHVYYQNCYFIATAVSDVTIDCNGLDTWSNNNSYYSPGGTVIFQNCSNPWITGDTYTHTTLKLHYCVSPVVLGNTIDVSSATNPLSFGLYLFSSYHPDIEGNTITGNSTYSDDGILLDSNDAGYFYNNTISNFPDAAIEQIYGSNGVVITGNNYYGIGLAGFVCSGVWSCSLNNLTYESNNLHSGTGSTFFATGSNGSGDFTNNSILGNSNGGSSPYNSLFGHTSNTYAFGTVSGNYIAYNEFVGAVTFQNTGGFTDGGGNHCTSAYATAITCP